MTGEGKVCDAGLPAFRQARAAEGGRGRAKRVPLLPWFIGWFSDRFGCRICARGCRICARGRRICARTSASARDNAKQRQGGLCLFLRARRGRGDPKPVDRSPLIPDLDLNQGHGGQPAESALDSPARHAGLGCQSSYRRPAFAGGARAIGEGVEYRAGGALDRDEGRPPKSPEAHGGALSPAAGGREVPAARAASPRDRLRQPGRGRSRGERRAARAGPGIGARACRRGAVGRRSSTCDPLGRPGFFPVPAPFFGCAALGPAALRASRHRSRGERREAGRAGWKGRSGQGVHPARPRYQARRRIRADRRGAAHRPGCPEVFNGAQLVADSRAQLQVGEARQRSEAEAPLLQRRPTDAEQLGNMFFAKKRFVHGGAPQ